MSGARGVAIFRTAGEWRALRASAFSGKSVGFVPTMGALHEGHGALISRAASECEIVVVSIFVNPTQFDNPDDLAKYPVTFDADRELCEQCGASAIFLPSFESLYPDNYAYKVTENKLATILEGAHRPGHFDGVLTVVLKLLNVIGADFAYFGEKDWQQLQLVRGMVDALFHPTEIVACETEREPDGLAMSSRNRRLNPAQRALASSFPKVLFDPVLSPEAAAEALRGLGFEVDYVAEHDGRRLGAVSVPPLDGGPIVRLIDNGPAVTRGYNSPIPVRG